MPDADPTLAYVSAAAALLALSLSPEQAQRVALHLSRTASLALLLDAAPLHADDEPAAIYEAAPFPADDPA